MHRGDVPPGTPVIGIGHSMGGAAMAFAELQAPGTFSQLFLFEVASSAFNPPPAFLQPNLHRSLGLLRN